MSKSRPELHGSAATRQTPLSWLGCGALALALTSAPLLAQGPGASGSQSNTQPAVANDNAITAGQTSLYNATGSNGASASSDSFKGSIVSGRNTGTVIDLPLDDAIARGLRQNLGVILQGSAVTSANGQRLEMLQQLLPTLSGSATIEVEQVSLAAYGIKFAGIPSVVGPFQVIDFRAYLTQNLVNINSLQSYVASRHNFASTKLTAEDARDLVVLTVGNAYLLCIADEARITAVNAELKTSKLTLDQATAAHDAGTSPRLDVLRAQVDYQTEQQTLISTTNQLAKDKIALARAIGLPLDQQFRLTDTAPYKTLDNLDPDAAFAAALKTRKDLQASDEQVKASEASRKAAIADRYPTLSASGDYGDIGTTRIVHGDRHAERADPADRQEPRRRAGRRCRARPGQGAAFGPDAAGERRHPFEHSRYSVGGEAGGRGKVERRPGQRGAERSPGALSLRRGRQPSRFAGAESV
jgi:outer membrane protein TolC